jgi:xanthine dehydrogenase YagR molybdenum-binding subunit
MSTHSFGAVFVEVAVDADTYMVQIRRVVATYDIGTLMNDKTGINQLERIRDAIRPRNCYESDV